MKVLSRENVEGVIHKLLVEFFFCGEMWNFAILMILRNRAIGESAGRGVILRNQNN